MLNDMILEYDIFNLLFKISSGVFLISVASMIWLTLRFHNLHQIRRFVEYFYVVKSWMIKFNICIITAFLSLTSCAINYIQREEVKINILDTTNYFIEHSQNTED